MAVTFSYPHQNREVTSKPQLMYVHTYGAKSRNRKAPLFLSHMKTGLKTLQQLVLHDVTVHDAQPKQRKETSWRHQRLSRA